jgi:hypothetical protein
MRAIDVPQFHSYTVTVKNITVTVDDAIYRRARIVAAERGTSISALVSQFLSGIGGAEDEFQRLKSAENVLREEIVEFRAGDRLARDDLHRRDTGGPAPTNTRQRKPHQRKT